MVNERDSSVIELGAANTMTALAWVGWGRAPVHSVTFWANELLSVNKEEDFLKDFHWQGGPHRLWVRGQREDRGGLRWPLSMGGGTVTAGERKQDPPSDNSCHTSIGF